MDRYATHQQALIRTALATTGPMLELGCGYYSTPLLAEVAWAQNRELLVQAADHGWLSQFMFCQRDGVALDLVDWSRWNAPLPRYANKWGFVFLDSEESTADRIRRLPSLLAVTDCVVMHDADKAIARPHWQEMSQLWQIVEHHFLDPQTVVLRRRA